MQVIALSHLSHKLGFKGNRLNRNGSGNNHTASKTTKVNKVKCILLKILASIYLLESFT